MKWHAFIARSLNAFYGLLALLPFMAISLLFGGLTGAEFWRIALALLNTLFVSLAAGICVSAFSREARGAMAGAFVVLLSSICFGAVTVFPLPAGEGGPARCLAGG